MQFPCSPDSYQRTIDIRAGKVDMQMDSCTAQGLTFAVTYARFADPQAALAGMASMQQAVRTNFDARVLSDQPARVPGMTPNPQARQQRLEGRLPSGESTQARALWFSHGLLVVQVTVSGRTALAEDSAPFFEGLAVRQ